MNNATGPWHKIDYNKPETLPDDMSEKKYYLFISENENGPVFNIFNTRRLGSIYYQCRPKLYLFGESSYGWIFDSPTSLNWTHWAEIRLPGEEK